MPARYDEKRDFDRTPEPRSAQTARGRYHARFVIHRHEATRLHYDLRIYNGTALSSWAVPKGFSYRPEDKHLAVQTEDHPLKYLEFEGVIPRGEYGGGTIRVWDSGFFDLARGVDVVAEIESGELKVVFHGRRVRGEWHLVNTRGSEWILFKARDAYARETAHLLSPSVDLSRLQNASTPPAFMRPARTVGPFDGPEWIFELDFPGVPVRVATGDSPSILTPQRRELTAHLPHLLDELQRFACNSALLDGVLVRDGPDGIPDSDAAARAIDEEDPALSLYVYDITVWDGFDTTSMPLIERKEVVRSIVPTAPSVLFVDYVASRGTELASEAARRGLKRLIAKRADSLYRAGRVSDWRRVDCSIAT